MVYRRYNYRRKRTYRKRYPNRRRIYGNAGRQLYKDVKTLKNLINVEFKYKDTAINLAPSNAGILTTLNGLAKGDNVNNREGRQVRWKSLEYDMEFLINSGATTANFVRTLFVIDKQTNAVAPNINQILDSVTTVSQRNLDNRKRFVILYDKVVQLNLDGKDQAIRHWYKKLDMKTVYDSSSFGDIQDITTNSLYFITISNVATNLPALQGNIRLRFIDN